MTVAAAAAVALARVAVGAEGAAPTWMARPPALVWEVLMEVQVMARLLWADRPPRQLGCSLPHHLYGAASGCVAGSGPIISTVLPLDVL